MGKEFKVSAYFSGHDHISEHLSSSYNKNDFTQVFVVGQGKSPDEKELIGECKNCKVEWLWDYPEDCLGVWGMLNVIEEEDGKLKPEFSFVDARNNQVLYRKQLKARKDPEFKTTTKFETVPETTTKTTTYTTKTDSTTSQ